MKIALIADVHGNIFALDAVLEDAKKNGADTYVFVGDYIFDMPFSNEVTERIRNLQTASSVHVIAGNKEARLEGYTNAEKQAWTYEQMGAVYQAFREIKTDNLDWLKSLPETLTIQLPGNRKLLALHIFTPLFPGGTGRERMRNVLNSSRFYMREHMENRFSHDEYLHQITQILIDDSYIEKFVEYDADIIVSGHTHLQWYAFSTNKLLINPGGCGQPLDGNPLAPYTLLTVTEEGIQIDERRLSYDIEAAIHAARNTKTYKHGCIFLESCFLSMQSGYCYISELREIARRIAEEQGACTPVKEPVDNDIWRLAGHEFFEAHGIKTKQSIRLIVTDLDGTLLRSDKTISDHTADILLRCRKYGILFAFATSRSENASSRFRALANPDITITSAGSIAKYKGKTLFRAAIPCEMATSIIQELKASEQITQITVDSQDYYFSSNPIDKSWSGWKDYANAVVTNFENPLPVSDVFKITVKALSNTAVHSLVSQVDLVDVMNFTGEDWYQIKSKEASKKNALMAVIAELGILPEEVVVFGDDYNDIDMLSLPGVVSVAMSNAIPEVKAVANYICGSNDEDGVARWLEANVL